MAGETISPNMNLIIPAVGTTVGPDWALDINASLSLVDQHNHASGNGVPISPPGLDINEELSFQGNDAVDFRSVRFTAQLTPIALPADLGCLYVAGVDLYYNDENGNQIRITDSGGVAGTPGSIGNLTPPAAVTYVSATPAYVFQSDASTSADLDAGSITIRENIANAKGITISSPAALANDYTLTLPGALPASNKILRVDNSGNISATLGVDGSTIVISSNNLSVGTITNANIANDSIDGDKITDSTIVAIDKLAANPRFSGTFGISGQDSFQTTGSTYTIGSNADNRFTIAMSYGGSGHGYRTLGGRISSAGAVLEGQGFTATRLAPGVYNVNPTVASTTGNVFGCFTAEAGLGEYVSRVSAIAAAGIQVTMATAGGVNTDVNFHFIIFLAA